jgi:hypothetical protein
VNSLREIENYLFNDAPRRDLFAANYCNLVSACISAYENKYDATYLFFLSSSHDSEINRVTERYFVRL